MFHTEKEIREYIESFRNRDEDEDIEYDLETVHTEVILYDDWLLKITKEDTPKMYEYILRFGERKEGGIECETIVPSSYDSDEEDEKIYDYCLKHGITCKEVISRRYGHESGFKGVAIYGGAVVGTIAGGTIATVAGFTVVGGIVAGAVAGSAVSLFALKKEGLL